jgi:pilus assembly protein Flp/PilA
MNTFRWVQNLYGDEEGVTAIEYGLLAALVGVAIIAGATLLGTNLDALFAAVAAKVATVTSGV